MEETRRKSVNLHSKVTLSGFSSQNVRLLEDYCACGLARPVVVLVEEWIDEGCRISMGIVHNEQVKCVHIHCVFFILICVCGGGGGGGGG